MSRSYIFLATGFEEIEALTVVDVLRRAGVDAKTVSITNDHQVVGAHGITVVADLTYGECTFADAEWLILPGGMPGSTNLASFEPLCALLKGHKGNVAAICAAPGVVLAPLGLLEGREATCYPGFDAACKAHGAIMRDAPVVALNNLVTASGPGAAISFALAIVEITKGESVAKEVGAGMLHYPKKIDYYF